MHSKPDLQRQLEEFNLKIHEKNDVLSKLQEELAGLTSEKSQLDEQLRENEGLYRGISDPKQVT